MEWEKEKRFRDFCPCFFFASSFSSSARIGKRERERNWVNANSETHHRHHHHHLEQSRRERSFCTRATDKQKKNSIWLRPREREGDLSDRSCHRQVGFTQTHTHTHTHTPLKDYINNYVRTHSFFLSFSFCHVRGHAQFRITSSSRSSLVSIYYNLGVLYSTIKTLASFFVCLLVCIPW